MAKLYKAKKQTTTKAKKPVAKNKTTATKKPVVKKQPKTNGSDSLVTVDKLGYFKDMNDTVTQKYVNDADSNIQLTKRTNFTTPQTGWLRIAKIKIRLIHSFGAFCPSLNIVIKKNYNSSLDEYKNIKLLCNSNNRKFIQYEGSGEHQFTKIRLIQNIETSELYIDVYADNMNSDMLVILSELPNFSKDEDNQNWELLSPTQVEPEELPTDEGLVCDLDLKQNFSIDDKAGKEYVDDAIAAHESKYELKHLKVTDDDGNLFDEDVLIKKQEPKQAYACVIEEASDEATIEFRYDRKMTEYEEAWSVENTGDDNPGWREKYWKYSGHFTKLNFIFTDDFKYARPKSCAYWFAGNGSGSRSSIGYIQNFENLNTTECLNMQAMFSYSGSAVKELNLTTLNTSKVTDMSSMFSCSPFTTLNLSNFDTSNVTTMNGMFDNCSVSSLDISSFDTKNVTDMYGMFTFTNINTLDISHFNTSKVTNMSHMFTSCFSLNSLNVSGLDTSNVTNITNMFNGAGNITSLDVSSFDLSKVSSLDYMFNGCNYLTNIYCNKNWNDWKNISSSTRMFGSCSRLPNYTSSYVDITYAYPSSGGKGYFTPKE